MKLKLYLLFILLVGLQSLSAGTVSSEKLRFQVTFPDSAGWSTVEVKKLSPEVTLWVSRNDDHGLILQAVVIDAPMKEDVSDFRRAATEWEIGMMKKFSSKVSSQFSKLSGREAYEVVTTLVNDGDTYYFSNWFSQQGQVSYYLTITGTDQESLSSVEAQAFLQSFALSS